MAENTIVDEAREYFLEEDFATTFDKFSEEYCSVFDESEENKLVYTEIYKKFCALFEQHLENFLSKKQITPEAFYNQCKKLQEEGDTDFLDFILALSDFEVFLLLMKDKAVRSKE